MPLGGIVHRVFVAEIEQLDGGVDLLVERLFGLGGRRAGRVRANQDDEHSEYDAQAPPMAITS
jgi:hypothetical protein